jgi:molybdate-binding protein
MTLDTIAAKAGLEFRLVADERCDVDVREERWGRPAVAKLRELLDDLAVRGRLTEHGFTE